MACNREAVCENTSSVFFSLFSFLSFLDYLISEMQSRDVALAGAIENFRGITQKPGSEANIGESGSTCSHTVLLVVL